MRIRLLKNRVTITADDGNPLELDLVQLRTRKPALESLDLYEAVGRLGPETALLLLHARGDEQIPYTVSEELHAAASEPKRLLVLPGGHHRSLQHDVEIQSVSRRYIENAVARRDQ